MGYIDRDTQREFQRNWMRDRRQSWIESMGGKCAKCGSTDRLEVDHIDRSLKTMHPRNIWSRRKEVQEKELSNCQVLCYGCHKEKTLGEITTKGLVCGELARYQHHGCRCDLCRAANTARVRRQRAAAKARKVSPVSSEEEHRTFNPRVEIS